MFKKTKFLKIFSLSLLFCLCFLAGRGAARQTYFRQDLAGCGELGLKLSGGGRSPCRERHL